MTGLWAALCLLGGLYASWHGAGGRAFAVTFTVFCFLFAIALLFAARGVGDAIASRFGPGGGLLLGASIFLAYLAYLLGTGTLSLPRVGALAGLVFVPLALAMSAQGSAPGAWQDFAIVAGAWVFVKFSPSHALWPYPGGRLAYVFTVLAAVGTALAAFAKN